jgi:hypothetical protein
MVLRFSKGHYIDMDLVSCVRWLDEFDQGIAVVDGNKIALHREEFEVLEKAFLWKHGYAIYDENMEKIEREKKDE